MIVASKGGAPEHPAWFLNLRDNPAVMVKTKDDERPMRARIAGAEERARRPKARRRSGRSRV